MILAISEEWSMTNYLSHCETEILDVQSIRRTVYDLGEILRAQPRGKGLRPRWLGSGCKASRRVFLRKTCTVPKGSVPGEILDEKQKN
jgi:hypothetical protein